MSASSTISKTPEGLRIASIRQEMRKVVIDWEDGHRSRFHYVWLRDNCFCPQCGDTWTGRRFVMLSDFPADPKPQSIACDEHGSLCVTWAGEEHRSSYHPTWLRRHCYSDQARAERRCRPALWDSGLANRLPTVDFGRASNDKQILLELYKFLRDFGIARVRGVPADMQGSRAVGELVGVLQDFGYGEIQDISSFVDYSGESRENVDEETGTYQVTLPTTKPVPPHNDQLFHHAHPGILFFHCVEANPEGGGASVMVDGFRVASDLREQEPQAFELLSRIPQTFTRYISEDNAADGGFGRPVDFRGGSRAICLDLDGEVAGFRYHSRATAPLDLPEHLIEPMYAANRALVSRLNNPAYQARFALQAGDVAIVDNHRVLHAREGFRGRRHLRLFQVGREEFHSRLRLLARELGDDSAEQVLPGGALG